MERLTKHLSGVCVCGLIRTKEKGPPFITNPNPMSTPRIQCNSLSRIRSPLHYLLVMTPSNYLTATETQALLAGGKITTDQIVQDHQARYQERDEKVKAWVCVNPTRAAEDIIEGDLNGVVVGIKDIFSTSPNTSELMVDTKDFPTQHGSPFHTGESPGIDAPIVRILRAAGAHIIGKTVRYPSPIFPSSRTN